MLAFITILVFSTSYSFTVNAENIIGEDQADDVALHQADYADDRVLVVLDNATSLLFNEYTPSDFSMINCKAVTNITQPTTNMVKAQIENSATAATETTMNIDTYEQILCLELNESGKEKVASAIKILSNIDGVKYVGPDYVISINETVTNDRYDHPWAAEKIQLHQAWDITTGSNTVMVGVLDSGIDSSHEDLTNKINYSLCRDFTGGSVAIESTPTDPNGHGTIVASIIGAQSNNSIGMSGVCWNVQLVSLKVVNANGSGLSSYALQAISYAKSQNIPILNMSIGWSTADNTYNQYNSPLSSVILDYPGLVVCSAGNDNVNLDNNVTAQPIEHDIPNLLCVGSSTNIDTKAEHSNYSATTVDIFAPGDGILGCYPVAKCNNNTHNLENSVHLSPGYHLHTGTSVATPLVTGVAALLLAKHPNLTPIQIKNAIIDNDDDCSALTGLCVSGGRLNAYKVLTGHIHYYGDSYSPGVNRHLSYCSCGAYIWESHVFDPNQSGNIRSCTICGYQVQIQNIKPEHEIE